MQAWYLGKAHVLENEIAIVDKGKLCVFRNICNSYSVYSYLSLQLLKQHAVCITVSLHYRVQIYNLYSASYLVVPTFDILTCDGVFRFRAGSTGATKF